MDPAPEPESPRKRQKLANDLDSRTLPEPVIATPITHTASMEVSRGLSAAEKQLQKEMEVGITEFVSPDLLGFTGILKKRSASSTARLIYRVIILTNHRYTDFLVNEILPSGQVLHLDNLKVPTRGQQTTHSTQTGIGSSVPLNPPREVQSGPAEPPAPQPAQAQPSGGKESRESVADELPTFQVSQCNRKDITSAH